MNVLLYITVHSLPSSHSQPTYLESLIDHFPILPLHSSIPPSIPSLILQFHRIPMMMTPEMSDNKKMKVKKGWLAVQVGLAGDDDDGDASSDDSHRFLIPISFLYHPLFIRLLDRAHDVFGYHTDGPLRLPCSVDDFLHLRWRIQKDPHHHHHHDHHHHHHHHLPHAFYFHSC